MAYGTGEQSRLLHDISIIDFVLVEFTEYLDTHPHDKNAMEYFNYYARLKNQLSKEFAEKYYPLTADASTETKEWSWVLAPMPWEGRNV